MCDMTYRLFIDDERDPGDVKWGSSQDQELYRDADWFIARNWLEVLVYVLSLGFPSTISFDHDLGDDKMNGFEQVRNWKDTSEILKFLKEAGYCE
jgi:hypothetical protein